MNFSLVSTLVRAKCDAVYHWTRISGSRIKVRTLLVLLLSWIFLTGCQAIAPIGTQVRVTGVVDGQTLAVVDPSGQVRGTQSIRLLSIAAPAVGQNPWDREAQKYLNQLVENGTTVLLETDVESDIPQPNGSTLKAAYIWNGDRLLNEAIVQSGYALADVRSPNLKYAERLTRAQEKARLLGIGLWNSNYPMRQTPEEFRRRGN